MSEHSSQTDPSMEEILGSIRRIISEDNAHGGQSHRGDTASDSDDDILELTDEVSVDEAGENRREPIFESRASASADDSHSAEVSARREPVLEIRPDEPVEAGVANGREADDEIGNEADARSAEWSGIAGEGAAVQREVADVETDEQAAVPTELGGQADDRDGAEAQNFWNYEAGGPQVEPEFAEDEAVAQQEEQSMSMASDESAESGPAEGGSEELTDTIMSETATSATSAALTELNRAMAEMGSKTRIGDGDVTLAEMVREMLRPMLREWLDQHLPGIVDRVVKREIQKLVDRTQDDD